MRTCIKKSYCKYKDDNNKDCKFKFYDCEYYSDVTTEIQRAQLKILNMYEEMKEKILKFFKK